MTVDSILLNLYMMGFNDELDQTDIHESILTNKLELKAYNLGRYHAIIGDEISSIDKLTNEEILKMIYDNN